MATLTETAYYSRNMVKYGAVAVVVLLVFRAAFSFSIAYWRKLHPPPPPPPTVTFGQLPAIVFPKNLGTVASYRLETITGTTVDLGDRATVYLMPVKIASLLALDRMKSIASTLGFVGREEKLTETRYRWTKDNPLPATLVADIISGSFAVEVAWQTDAQLLTQTQLPNETIAVSEAQDQLRNLGLLANDLVNSAAKVTFLRADINELVKAVSLSEADFVRVDLFRTPIDELPVYPPNPDRGAVSMVFSSDRTSGKRVVQLNYNYFPVSYDQSATYPVKTTDAAWQELQSGDGFIARVKPGVKTAVVRRISLAYFDSALPQNHLQPVYVFEGDDDFVGYVPAIANEWIQE